eukprot:5137146-Amphidinium_carterae.1
MVKNVRKNTCWSSEALINHDLRKETVSEERVGERHVGGDSFVPKGHSRGDAPSVTQTTCLYSNRSNKTRAASNQRLQSASLWSRAKECRAFCCPLSFAIAWKSS